MGITAYALILPGATIDHNPLLCVLPPSTRSAVGAGYTPGIAIGLEFQFSVASVHQPVTHRYVRNVMSIARTSHGIRPVKSANKYGQGSYVFRKFNLRAQ